MCQLVSVPFTDTHDSFMPIDELVAYTRSVCVPNGQTRWPALSMETRTQLLIRSMFVSNNLGFSIAV